MNNLGKTMNLEIHILKEKQEKWEKRDKEREYERERERERESKSGRVKKRMYQSFQNPGRGMHSNTGVVHMHDQRFSKYTPIEICPFQETQPLNENFTQFCT